MKKLIAVALSVLLLHAVARAQAAPSGTYPDVAKLRQMAARFAPTPLEVDVTALDQGDREALVKLIQAARLCNDLYLEQAWRGNQGVLHRLRQDTSPLGRAQLDYFWLNKGPWSRLDNNAAFLPGVPAHVPPTGNFYPEDMTRQEFETWLQTLSPAERTQATGFFTVIRRNADRGLRMVSYSEEYRTRLEKAAGLLREAAALTPNRTLKTYLNTRATAFLSNDYYQSDVDWMDLDAPLDVTIGPYETYTDELFGYKAAFEAFVSLRDDLETSKIAAFSRHLQEIENNLPEDPSYRNPKLGALAPIRVVNQIICTGDANHGVQTAAYNLPNDERVVREKGSKRVMLKNVQEAKFRQILVPIAGRVLSKEDQGDVAFDSFFTHILAHELVHGLGPHHIKVGGQDSNPRKALKDLYSAIEEAKADATGLFALQYMMDHATEMGLGTLMQTDAAAQRRMYTTFLASSFRTLRFGLNEAHGKGMALQVNYLLDHGGFVVRPDGTFAVDGTRIKQAVQDLVRTLLTIEAQGDYAAAKKMLDDLANLRPETRKAIQRLEGLPVDIAPHFVTADQLAPPAAQH